MNFLEQSASRDREAKLKYLDADFQVLREGDFVRCALTGDPIALASLRYWDVVQQVAYKTAEAAFRQRLNSLRNS